MATPKQITEPAAPAVDAATEPAQPAAQVIDIDKLKTLDPRRKVFVRDSRTGRKIDNPVPETHLVIFPHLREVASKKEGK
ncbi:hypothetical protein [Paeniglutamicibacter gangotriensis]|uniref:Uncharacterized protein n=1 Tax=Paeniglutamicibacter gangotriensis Lz1y TaxID=1276920 RepID=M7MTT8_9MICC|nr:hypothetical protein [Paeniglutamicibacter gangotriensis]EMQ98345.1 hypothetical protein ADIAG_02363 [Paeniglutamicibacter gangotriensis Lz1y]